MDTYTTLPPFASHISTSIPASTISPTFSNIMNQPITSLFPSQSIEGSKSIPDDNTEDDDVMVSFTDIHFDPGEENIPDHMLMCGKQFKIRNHKLNSLLQLQANAGNRHSVSGIEVDVMLKALEPCLKALME